MMARAFLDLQRIAMCPVEVPKHSEEVKLPQVHALNCIRSIFINTKLGTYSEAYVAEGLDLAGMCLESDL